MNIKQQLIAHTPYSYGKNNKKKFITIHETANTSRGADAQAHANLQSNGNSRNASWHWQVDDKEAIQSFTHDFQLWHAGDGRSDGNLNSIGIEICVNSDGDFQKAVSNVQELVKIIMDEENIQIENVVTHKRWSGKNCPANLLNMWDDFIEGVSGKSISKPSKKPQNKPTNKANLTVDGKWGKSTSKALQAYFGTPQDGILSHQFKNSVTNALYSNTAHFSTSGKGSVVIRELQKKVKSTPDGLLGPSTVRQLQKYLGTVVDGKLSRPSLVVKELQKSLNAGTF